MNGSALTPMLATVGRELPSGRGWAFEPKYDGIRILAFVADGSVALLSRNGNAKTAQFPEIVDALAANPPSLFENDGLAESLLQSAIERVVAATSSFHS